MKMYIKVIFLLVVVMADAVEVSILSVCKGASKALYCKQQVNYQKSFVRFMNKTNAKVKERIGKYHIMNDGALLVKNIQESDVGIYRYACNYYTSCSNSSSRFVCNVKLELSNCEVLRVPRGSTATLICVTKRPKSDRIKTVSWSRNADPGEAKKTYSGRLQATSTALKITNAQRSDEGVYICVASFVPRKDDYRNPKSSYRIHLVVEEPSNSTNVTAMTIEAAEAPTSRNVSSLSNSTPSTTITSTTKDDTDVGTSVILAQKSYSSRISRADCMWYTVSSVILMTTSIWL